jgi:hypothetical protein
MKIKMPWRPISWEGNARVFRAWFAFVGFDVGNWAIGFGFDVAPTAFSFEFGPLFIGGERDEPPPKSHGDLLDWNGTLCRITIQRLRMELRLEYDLNIWRFGYIMADMHDQGIYFGPFNLQIEYDKFYDWPDDHTLPPRLQCQCDVRRRQ